jgi:tetratricopeptide (TPR) repeat protein
VRGGDYKLRTEISSGVNYYDEAALIERLTAGIRRANQRAVFLVGSAVTAPAQPHLPGVPGVEGVIDLIRAEFDDRAQISELDKALDEQDNRYQAAFTFLLGRRGQQAANEIIKRAVWKARKPVIASEVNGSYMPTSATPDDACLTLDSDFEGWLLTPSVEALGQLIAGYPDRFGRAILTTNFDPLLEVAIAKFGGHYFRTVLHRDGNLGQTHGPGCHVIHLHGYWYGSDTLHTPRQLLQPRPRLKASLASLIKGATLVVSGYGGWDDTFAEALMEVVLDDNAYPEILWTFQAGQPHPSAALMERLSAGIDRGRVSLYSGIDCQGFFPRLLERWRAIETPLSRIVPLPRSSQIHPLVDSAELATLLRPEGKTDEQLHVLEGDEEDRPPVTDVCVGRERELAQITTSDHRVCFITGIGGQGKSTLAAQYFSLSQKEQRFDYYVWRDCKEEGERFENQLISLIEKLSRGSVSGTDLTKQPVEILTDILLKHAANKSILLIFDNVDHYVDLENNKMTGSVDRFIDAFLKTPSKCRTIFTCRPFVQYQTATVLSQKIEGLDFSSAIELFTKRGAASDRSEIQEAHTLTGGHAFWLDLLAAQVAKKAPNLKLRNLVEQISTGKGELPTSTLQSIWETLHDRQKLVLRALAETVRPETESQVGDYLSNKINFNQVMRALRSLRSLNLIVVKYRAGSPDLVELHPLIREFIRRTFRKQERLTFIDVIIAFYSRMMGLYQGEVRQRPSLSILSHWTEKAELSIEAGKLQDAFDCLVEVRHTFAVGDFPGEFARVAKLLFRSVDWEEHDKYKNFDQVFNTFFEILVKFGRTVEYEPLLEKYAATVPLKNARYVNYCNLQCYMHWVNAAYAKAIEWGVRGKELKDRSNVDTQFSTNHYLALAQRDSGVIDPALPYFLAGRKLEDVIDVDELDEGRGGHHYGNIGRCLHLMGQIEPALICYRKSAVLIEKDRELNHIENKAFIREWIGELLLMKNEMCLAKTFLEAAKLKWELVGPSRAPDIEKILLSIRDKTLGCESLEGENIERFCIAWIFGRESEFVPI